MFNALGFAFVSEKLPNAECLETQINDKCEELVREAREKLDAWLNEQGLSMEMGVVGKIGRFDRTHE